MLTIYMLKEVLFCVSLLSTHCLTKQSVFIVFSRNVEVSSFLEEKNGT